MTGVLPWLHMDKTANIRVRLEPELHKEFTELCKRLDVNGSAVVRQAIRGFLEKHRGSSQADLFNFDNDEN